MTDEPPPGTIGAISIAYAEYCARVARAIADQADVVETLIDAMISARAIHCYGFGRSGNAVASLAIRLRHFQRFLKPVWLMSDQVRNPFEPGEILVVFSREGTRFELLKYVEQARKKGLACAFVTCRSVQEMVASHLADPSDVVITLPSMDPDLLSPDLLYGGGDFELAATLFQEMLVTRIGSRLAIPTSEVQRYHVF